MKSTNILGSKWVRKWFHRYSQLLVLQVTNAGARRPGFKARCFILEGDRGQAQLAVR